MTKYLRQRGDIAELEFVIKAIQNNLQVSKPLMGFLHYDYIVDCFGQLARVQVKATSRYEYGYKVAVSYGATKIPYSPNEIDYFAIYIVPEKIWYLIPVDVLGGTKNITLQPDSEKCKFSKYKENWNIILPPRKYVIPKKTRKRAIGGIYETKTNSGVRYRVKYRNIYRRFQDKKEAEAFLEDLRKKAAEDYED